MAPNSFEIYKNALIFASFLTAVSGQQVGTYQTETHPSMTWQTCSSGGSCTTNQGSIVLDANWRWVHEVGSTTNCYTGNTWDDSICDSDDSCAQNCALDGADYQSTYGITTSGNEVKIAFVTNNSNGKNVGSRLYMMQDENNYEIYKLLGQEFTFDVDVSTLGCGLNGALYFVSMYQDGGVSEYSNNEAGAKYGVGYCDAQCPSDLKFIGGQANIDNWQPSSNNENTGVGGHGSCCPEMDIWESNMYAQAVTAHSCDSLTPVVCSQPDCGGTYSDDRYSGPCDPDGCDFNPYRMGVTDFYGPGLTIDTSQKFTVVTQFITEDGSANGNLQSIKRYYVQNGNVYAQPDSTISGVTGNAITSDYCSAELSTFGEEGSFQTHGGLDNMSQALKNGMVLVMSLWDDYYANMLWLDSTYPTDQSGQPGALRGPCATSSGEPSDIESSQASAYVAYSNIRVGPINSTFTGTSSGGGGNPGGGSSTTTTSPPHTTTSSGGGATQTHWGQCGGQGYSGPTQCASPYTCQYSNPWYSQCL